MDRNGLFVFSIIGNITHASEGGHVVVAGESHGTLRVYRVHASGLIEKTNDIIAHTVRESFFLFRSLHFALSLASQSNERQNM